MGVIRQLPSAVVNQIAAGEVVERPASVVKELLENAIDARATRIDLTVERGGKDLVRVADNGEGISPEDLVLAFQPHATSKLALAEDLYRIRTLGFRGEALAAIAEIAKVRCQTRPATATEGSELSIEAGVFGAVRTCGCPPGTVIEVRNLFQNIPVRRAFLKSDLTESGHVVDMFSRIALAHPEIHLTYRSGGKVIHDLPPVAGTRERIAIFFGRELAESLLWVEGRLENIHLWGYVAHPSQSRASAKGQFLFVGGRYVRDRALSHALGEAYRGLLMTGRLPVVFLHLELPAEELDVNVHPTKVEVRFRDSNRVYTHLLATLRQTFLKSDLHARLQAAQEPGGPADAGSSRGAAAGAPLAHAGRPAEPPAGGRAEGPGRFELAGEPPDRQAVASWFEPARPGAEIPDSVGQRVPPAWAQSLPLGDSVGPGDAFDEFAGQARAGATESRSPGPRAPADGGALAGHAPGAADSAAPSRPAATDHEPVTSAGSRALSESTSEFDSGRAGAGHRGPNEWAAPSLEPRPAPFKAIQVHDSYLIAETGDGLMVIDQHALHERILYEELRVRVAQGKVEAQRLLVPEPVDLPAPEAAAVLEQTEVLAQLGLEVEPFGGDTVLVRGIPAIFAHAAPDRLVRDLAEHLRSQPLPPSRDGLLAELLHMVACKAAIKAGQPLAPPEIAALLERRHLVADSHHCPHGRPTALVFTRADLEKQFGRT
jgi:DNA mismatch repair protein MutL